MQEFQQAFIEFVIEQEILRFGSFKLKSGRTSPYFFNAGLFNTGSALDFIGSTYAAALAAADIDYDLLFGPAYKGIPLVSVTAAALANRHGINKPYCFNRKEAKDHGEGGLTVGAPLQGRALIVDDVITAGTAVREVMDLFERTGTQPAGIIVALDRQERGTGSKSAIQEIEEQYKIPVLSIISLAQIIEYLGRQDDPALATNLEAVKRYRDEYGVNQPKPN
jgi:orotate phosphoribosyltransferase